MQGIDALPGPLDAILYVNEPLQGALLDIGGRIQLVLLFSLQSFDLLINTMR